MDIESFFVIFALSTGKKIKIFSNNSIELLGKTQFKTFCKNAEKSKTYFDVEGKTYRVVKENDKYFIKTA